MSLKTNRTAGVSLQRNQGVSSNSNEKFTFIFRVHYYNDRMSTLFSILTCLFACSTWCLEFTRLQHLIGENIFNV